MKNIIILSSLLTFTASATSDPDTNNLKSSFHDFGITKCDSVIEEHMGLSDKSNWVYNIGSHSNANLGEGVNEASLSLIYGSKGDSLRYVFNLVQGVDKCYLQTRPQLTFSGKCSENIDDKDWFLKDKWPYVDFERHLNAWGLDSYVKEIEVGAFKACLIEYDVRNSYPFS
jgi:hypothetical protein